VQPTFCVVDGRLHVAESALGMRAFRRAQEDGADAMVLDDAIVAANVPGEVLATHELRFDPARTYRAFYDVWLPLLTMAIGSDDAWTRDEMPEPDDFAEYVRPVRVVFSRDGERVGMHSLGVVGGPVLSAYAMVIGQMAGLGPPSAPPLVKALAEHELQAAWVAIERFRAREQRLPKDLAELFTAEALADDALFLPGDPHAEALALPGEREVRVSFRYFPDNVPVDLFGATHAALLIQCEPSISGRVLLDDDGAVHEMWGDASQATIDSFGK
jgi:hypothetical protein